VRAEAPAKIEKAPTAVSARPGGYYQDDGPGANPPPNLEAIPDAQPRVEPLHKFANNAYSVLGQTYVPDTSGKPYQARGIASWYGKKFHGQRTSSGEAYDMYGMTAAHPTLPIPSYVRVSNPKSGKSVIVRVNDRGPFHADRVIDLSYTAAYKLGIVQAGSGLVEVESIDPAQWTPAPAVAIAAAEKPQPLPVAEGENYWLQLGAFGVQANAEQLLAKLKVELGALGESVSIYAAEGLYRLRAGPFKTSAEAGDVAAQLQRLTNIQPVLLR
jgi:rare lipoprotein A